LASGYALAAARNADLFATLDNREHDLGVAHATTVPDREGPASNYPKEW
jgi:hypothetical protein